MIFALEGPDGCGKTTARARLMSILRDYRVRWLTVLPVSSHSAYRADPAAATARDATLLQSVYDRKEAYVCARFFAVTAPAYARLRGESEPFYPQWHQEVRVYYIDVPVVELAARQLRRDGVAVSFDHIARLKEEYEHVLASWRWAAVVRRETSDGAADALAEDVRTFLKGEAL